MQPASYSYNANNPYSDEAFIWPKLDFNDSCDHPDDSDYIMDVSITSSSSGDDYAAGSSTIASLDKKSLTKVEKAYKQKISSTHSASARKKGIHKDSFKHAGLKSTRTVKPASQNLAPSTTQDSSTDTDELIKDHASLRIQLMYIRLLALHNLAVRSDNSLSDIKVSIEHANYQFGKGNAAKGTHGCHASAEAGAADNLREMCVEQTIQEKKLTPRKIQLLIAKHFPKKAIDKLQDPSTQASKIKRIYAKYWPKKYAHESVLSGTELECRLNATNELDSALNLKCDKSLETEIRPLTENLIKSVMQGAISPEEGTKHYHEMIVHHFNTVIPALEEKIRLVEEQMQALDQIKANSNTPPSQLQQLLQDMSVRQAMMVQPQSGVAKTTLDENSKFLRASLHQLQDDQPSTVHTFSKWFTKNYNILKEEASDKLASLKKLLHYNIQEKEGSILPPFEFISGNFNPTTQLYSPLTPRRIQARQLTLLEPVEIKDIKKNLFPKKASHS